MNTDSPIAAALLASVRRISTACAGARTASTDATRKAGASWMKCAKALRVDAGHFELAEAEQSVIDAWRVA